MEAERSYETAVFIMRWLQVHGERAAEGTLTDLFPVMLDTLTMHPLVLMRWGTHSWVMWYTDLRHESTRHVLQRPTGNTPSKKLT